jgi:hypothetical protein
MSNLLDTEPQDQKEKSSSDGDFVEKFVGERRGWTDSVTSIGRRFREVENLAEVQVDLYTKRQEAIEYQYKLIAVHTKLKNMFAVQWKRAYEEAGRDDDVRFSEKEKTKTADAGTANLKFKTETVSNQIEFFRETIKTIDNMIFGVKHRIEIENFKAGMK